jgi:hypothetical protein
MLPLLRRARRPRPKAGQLPASRAALIQLVATAGSGALSLWLVVGAGIDVSALQWAALQGCIACALAAVFESAWWWRPIHLLFAPALILGLATGFPPQFCLAALLLLVGVYWTSFRSQVPLYLSGPAAWREVAGLVPAQAGARVIDLGCGLGGLVDFVGRLRPDCSVDGVEAAPLPYLASQLRKRVRSWRGKVFWGDLWRVDLSKYDVAHAYLSPVPMPALWRKACLEMRPGSLLLSHSFAVPGVMPTQIRQLPGNARIFVYRIGG